MEQFALTDRVVVVTGASRGIGKAIALGMAEAGADVVPMARTTADVEAVADSCEDHGVEALPVSVDVTDVDAVREGIDAAVEEFGGVDCVVNNAGVNPEGALGTPEHVDDDSMEFVLDVNLKGAFRIARAAADSLAERGGSVINVASVGGLVGLPRQHPYVASKHGMVGMTKSMALDWAPEVRVNGLAPGYVATDLTEELTENEKLRKSIENRTPLSRFAEPEEIAGPAVFLASDAAAYVTGTTLAADGGWTAR
ncbi:SDR family NAD(P)-dependent oxidoreductase [Natronomonas sp. EA1]|uniref:SDR family NAD(P)-dependent oxidoreductase n=1 Tax=Natronomonas sp. EA1 TaxID=3421655 RepID=UPI003EBE4BF4